MVVKHIIRLLIVGHLLVLTWYSVIVLSHPRKIKVIFKSVFTVMALNSPAVQMDTFCTRALSTTPLSTLAFLQPVHACAEEPGQYPNILSVPLFLSKLISQPSLMSHAPPQSFVPRLARKRTSPPLALPFLCGKWWLVTDCSLSSLLHSCLIISGTRRAPQYSYMICFPLSCWAVWKCELKCLFIHIFPGSYLSS